MQVYIGGSFPSRFRIKEWVPKLAPYGFVVKASWLDIPITQGPSIWGNDAPEQAQRDLSEVAEAELVIIDTIEKSSTGGSDAEIGGALILGHPVWVVGPIRNGYHTLAKQRFESWESLLTAVAVR